MKISLRKDYEILWKTMIVSQNKKLEIIVDRIISQKGQYESVEMASGVPWYMVACIHYMESSLDFKRQIYNGQRWNRETTLIPKGKGPWDSWHDSSVDAMKELNADMIKIFGNLFLWDAATICYAFEKHNGWGYRKYHRHVKSPYLWSYSNHYTKGKYVADGKWSNDTISKQLGTMVIIKRLLEKIAPPIPTPIPTPISKPIPKPVVKKKPKKKSFWEKIKSFFSGVC